MSIYCYGVVEAGCSNAELPTGLFDAPVRILHAGGVGLAVSDAPDGLTLRIGRRHLAAHARVQAALAERSALLPSAFGAIADTHALLAAAAESASEELLAALARVRGAAEMTLRVLWQVPNIFEFMLERHPNLKILRDQTLARADDRGAKVALGEAFADALQHERETLLDAVRTAIAPACREIADRAPRQDSEAVRLSCLVDADAGVEMFEQRLADVAAQFGDEILFEYSGPWPAHSFVDVRLAMPARLQEAA